MISISNLKIGSPIAGGYFAGIIDTTKGNIRSNDAYQIGARYAIIVAPKSLESPTTLAWCSLSDGGGAENNCMTRWDGLSSTNHIINTKSLGSYPAFNHINNIRSSSPVPYYPNGSDWYLPAMIELVLLYRYFNPNTEIDVEYNETRIQFPSNSFNNQAVLGRNISAEDTDDNPYTTSAPEKTPLSIFHSGGAQALDREGYWTSTEGYGAVDSRWCAWIQLFTASIWEGVQGATLKDHTTLYHVRPVRRILL